MLDPPSSIEDFPSLHFEFPYDLTDERLHLFVWDNAAIRTLTDYPALAVSTALRPFNPIDNTPTVLPNGIGKSFAASKFLCRCGDRRLADQLMSVFWEIFLASSPGKPYPGFWSLGFGPIGCEWQRITK